VIYLVLTSPFLRPIAVTLDMICRYNSKTATTVFTIAMLGTVNTLSKVIQITIVSAMLDDRRQARYYQRRDILW
jgi:hypothetical protein